MGTLLLMNLHQSGSFVELSQQSADGIKTKKSLQDSKPSGISSSAFPAYSAVACPSVSLPVTDDFE
jgi:hypothetical protein